MTRCRSDTELLEHFTKRLPENQEQMAGSSLKSLEMTSTVETPRSLGVHNHNQGTDCDSDHDHLPSMAYFMDLYDEIRVEDG